MRRNLKVIQINGFRGLFLTLFIISCLIAGFIVFPGFLSMNIWNYLAVKTSSFPAITFQQGLLLWAIIVLSAFLFNKRKFIVSLNAQQELSDDEVKDVISKIKSQAAEHNIFLQKELKDLNELQEETKEVSTDSQEN